eukprot:2010785-Pleurochrysis_carterae.AAC.5
MSPRGNLHTYYRRQRTMAMTAGEGAPDLCWTGGRADGGELTSGDLVLGVGIIGSNPTRRPPGDRGQRLGLTKAKSPSSPRRRQVAAGRGGTDGPHPRRLTHSHREGRPPVDPTAHGLRA